MLTEPELLDYCNRFRRAGGAEELTKLQPGKLAEPGACLIAVNLNFACRIAYRVLTGVGLIASNDERLAVVAAQLGLMRLVNKPPFDNWVFKYQYELPISIGHSAEAFDRGDYPDHLYLDGK